MKRKTLLIYIILFIVSTFLLISLLFSNTVKATAASFLARAVVNECHSKVDWQLCYANKLSNLNRYIPFELSIQVFNEVQKTDPQAEKCHSIAHKLGESEVIKDQKNWLSMFKFIPGNNKCFNGFIHGAWEGEKRIANSFKITPQSATKLCNDIVLIINDDNTYPCGSALGHIFLLEKNNDLSKAAVMCSKLREGLIRYCLDGLFMEYITQSNTLSLDITTSAQETEPYVTQIENICKMFKKEKAVSCWREISILYFKIVGPDLKKISEYCNRGFLNNYIDACYFNILSAVVMDKDFNKNQLATMCERYTTNSESLNLCYDWAITGVIYTDAEFAYLVDDICREAPAIFKDRCWVMKDERLKMYKPSI